MDALRLSFEAVGMGPCFFATGSSDFVAASALSCSISASSFSICAVASVIFCSRARIASFSCLILFSKASVFSYSLFIALSSLCSYFDFTFSQIDPHFLVTQNPKIITSIFSFPLSRSPVCFSNTLSVSFIFFSSSFIFLASSSCFL